MTRESSKGTYRDITWLSSDPMSLATVISQETDDIVESITKISNAPVQGGATGPVSTFLSSVTPARGLHPGATERAETRATAQTVTGGVLTLTSKVSTPTSRRMSGQTLSSSTARMIITSKGVSPDVPEMTASLATTPEVEASTAIPRTTPSVFNSEPAITLSLTHSSVAETSLPVPTLSASHGESEATTSWVTHSAETNPTSNAPHSESDTTPSMATGPGAEDSSAPPISAVSPGLPDMVISLVTSSGEKHIMSTPIMTDSPGQSGSIASMATHPGTETSSVVPTLSVTPSVMGLVTSLVPSSGAETSPSVQMLTSSPDEPQTTISWVTHPAETSPTIPKMTPSVSRSGLDTTTGTSPGTETSSTLPTSTVSPGEPGVVNSLLTSSGTETSMVISTLTDSLPETSASLATYQTTDSSVVPPLTVSPSGSRIMTSLVTSSERETSTTIPILTASLDGSETKASLATNIEAEMTSAIPTMSVSPGVLQMVTSFVTSSETMTTMAIPTVTDSPGQLETIASLANSAVPTLTVMPGVLGMISLAPSSGAEISPAVQTLTASSGEPEITTSWVTHPAETSFTVSRTTPYVSHSETETTSSMATSPGIKASSAIPALTVSLGVPNMMTSIVTSSWAESSLAPPTLSDSPGQPGTTVLPVTYPGAQTSSTIPTVSPGVSETMVSSSGSDSSTLFPTLTDHLHEPETTASLTTSPKSEDNPVPTLTSSPGALLLATSVVTSFETETIPLMTDTPHESKTTASLIIHPGTEDGSVIPSTASPRALDLATSAVTSFETETSTTIPTMTDTPHEPKTTASLTIHPGTGDGSVIPSPASPRALDLATSAVTGSEREINTAVIPTITDSSHEPESTVLLATHPSAEASTKIYASTLSPHLSETTTSLVIRPGVEISTALPAQTVSLGATETTSSLFTTPRMQTSRNDSAPTVSPGVSVKTASISTHPGTETSTTAPLTHFHGIHGQATAPATAGKPNAAASWSTETSPLATSIGLPGFSTTVTRNTVTLIPSETPTPPTTSHGKGTSPTTILKTTTTEATPLAATSSGLPVADTTATSQTLARRPSAPLPTPRMSTSSSVSVTSGTTAVPSLMPFTVNFTITNLSYTEDMGRPGSEIFNTTERVLQRLLRTLFKNSSVGSLYAGCRLTFLRAEKDQASTRIDAVCTYRSDPTSFSLDREQLYWELSQLTYGITWLGPFTLDRNTLHVNGYNYQLWTHTTSTIGVGSSPVPFTLNFTITDMLYTPDMGLPGSKKFNSTEKILNCLLMSSFKNTSIGPFYSGCRLTLLRSEKDGTATGVDTVCTYHPKRIDSVLDIEQLYQELSQQTYGITQLGHYTLDRDSLYVNGYNLRFSTPATSTPVTSTFSSRPSTSLSPTPSSTVPSLVPFTIKFTIISLHYTEDMGRPGSEIFNTTERILNRLLRPLFQNSSIGPLYSGCRLTLLRPEKDGSAIGVDTICTHHPDSMGSGLDRERLYWELSLQTDGVTQLGSFTLDRDSLYVNGYTHQASTSIPSAAGPTPVPFTLNFTITNFRYTEDMRPGSTIFNSTESFLQGLLKVLFTNSSIGSLYTGCRLTALRPEKDGTTIGVDTICIYHPDPAGFKLNRELLYWELSNQTYGVTQLGPYTLERGSLYVNGYTSPVLISGPTASGHALVLFTLNFTVTNMRYTQDMHPGSVKFRFTEKVLQGLLELLLNKTSMGPFYSGCRLASLRPANGEAATKVDVVCTYRADPEGHRLDRERLYWEMSYETHGITHLGHYILHPESLYVNGYTYKTLTPTNTTGEVSEKPFTLNFTIDNLRYSADMGRPSSLKFNITDSLMQHLLSPLFQRSSLGARYGGCRVTALRSVKNGAQTAVDIICIYRQHLRGPSLSAKQVFHELSRQTRGITRLGPYSLDKDSLYLNGYNERGPAEPPTTPEPVKTSLPPSSVPVPPEATTAVGHTLKTFTLNFTISNFQYSSDMGNPGSIPFNTTESALQNLLEPLFQKSSLGSFFLGCKLISLRPKKDRAATAVDTICTYRSDPVGPGLDREQLYWELNQLTNGVTQLGPYTLERGSLSIGGYRPQSLSIQSKYQLHFRIINWNLSNADPTSSEYIALLRDIQDKVTRLYKGSQLKDKFHSCMVTDLRVDSMLVTINALFSSNLDSSLVKQVFLDGTLNSSSHWLGATYQLVDLQVIEVEPTVHLGTAKPTSSSSPQHFQLNFTITNLLYSQDIAQPNSTKYLWNKRNIQDALNQLFRNSSIKSYFLNCQVLAFRSVPHSNHTGVNSLCNFSPLAGRLDRVAIYEEFLQLTQNGTQLWNFTLERNSVLVDGYSPSRKDVFTKNSDLPFWAIILICLAGLLGLITCLICCFLVTICLRKKERDYAVQRRRLSYYLPHLDLRKLQ
nr:mucin-16 [Dasypus novemcinctus]